MFRKKWPWVIGVLVMVGIAGVAYSRSRQEKGTLVTAENVQRRDLESLVSASGKIDPRRSVNISAQSIGRVTRIGVREGDRVKAGQFLLQIDPVSAQSAVRRDEAAVAGARTALEQSRAAIQSAQASLDVAVQTYKRQQELWAAGLTTRETLEKAEAEVQMRESDISARQQEVRTREEQVRQQQAGLASSRYNLAQVRFESPFDGIVTRRNVEEGENVVMGTMNNAGTVLLTVADMSVIEAEIEVDETDVPLVQIGQKAAVTIDAIDGRTFPGHVTEIGNSPIQATGAATGARTATNFKVVVTLDEVTPEIRPGFTCTAEISTASKTDIVTVPIQALTVRELEYDKAGAVVPRLRPAPASRFSFGAPAPAATQALPTELPVGHTRKEVEGVFVIRDGKAQFQVVEVGIAGERYFEVTSGLQAGDRVITGPFDSVRNLFEGDPVRENTPTPAK
ncbi:MAG TPA: efflux RND transporter periplasmic adaptor subunit [Vicinamibacterales bacterium]|nr:efflux RND transporter periplasmic adaptor subunit [Vicinamibacterales bacterium]